MKVRIALLALLVLVASVGANVRTYNVSGTVLSSQWTSTVGWHTRVGSDKITPHVFQDNVIVVVRIQAQYPPIQIGQYIKAKCVLVGNTWFRCKTAKIMKKPPAFPYQER